MSKTKLGSDPFSEGVNALIQDTRKTASKKASKLEKQQASKKATYYIKPDIIKGLKYLAIDKDKDLSALVNEALEDLIKKYKGK
jgi:hypothetical protein